MSTRRAPSAPPEIPGYDFRQVLGSGGFADVFLYEQAMPARPVAVKVLLPDAVDRDLLEDFRQEANVMAQLSTHPSIVTVYGAAVTADGRPYLAMEYCPRPNLGVRFRKERFSVAEVLTLGVQIAGAVETAHRAGVLHRDIKPANILVTAYNRPALTDFGIATTIGEQSDGAGMSIPWSPPESFAARPWSGRESDVFSLAATLFTLLAGRTPFEMPGMGNSSLDLITRIQQGQVSPLARSDVPASLQSVLASAMEVEPHRRYSSAMALGRALQQVEAEMALPVTPLDVLDDTVPADVVDEEDGGATRIRGVVTIDPDAAAPPREMPRSAPQPLDDRTVLRAPVAGAEPALDGHPAAPPPHAERARRRVPLAAIIGGAIVLVAVLVVGLVALVSPKPEAPPEEPEEPPTSQAVPSAPIAVEGTVTPEGVTFTWVNPQPEPGDTYVYRTEPSDALPSTASATEPTVTIPLDPDGETCINVSVVRASQRSSTFTQECVNG